VKIDLRNAKGATLVEFAIISPVFFVLILCVVQIGNVYLASSTLRHIVGQGARVASLYPVKTDSQIIAAMNNSRFGVDPSRLTIAPIVRGTTGTSKYVDISVSYNVPVEFVVVGTSLTLTQSRRAYTH